VHYFGWWIETICGKVFEITFSTFFTSYLYFILSVKNIKTTCICTAVHCTHELVYAIKEKKQEKSPDNMGIIFFKKGIFILVKKPQTKQQPTSTSKKPTKSPPRWPAKVVC